MALFTLTFSILLLITASALPMTREKGLLVVVILDKSGSMVDHQHEVIRAYNGFVGDLWLVDKKDITRLTMIQFDHVVVRMYTEKRPADVEHLNEETYSPDGATALYDAVADGIDYADEYGQEFRHIVGVILTDGLENRSVNTSKAELKELINDRLNTDRWAFLYRGPNHVQFGHEFGLNDNAVGPFQREILGVSFEEIGLALEYGINYMSENSGEVMPVIPAHEIFRFRDTNSNTTKTYEATAGPQPNTKTYEATAGPQPNTETFEATAGLLPNI